ncbi:hypothetical protein BLNAU_6495 [Blattamonas nauphoetae]|uniref:Uncharacterized protein n=1 Tax=Blattamonas nauphoetae TaxID=2049346 RepID=A0ABQ9Y3Z9_9EUKA|nr:hypothetical protein BLNAU_6495 [Blattamonas nauphoetae]
MVPLKNLLWRFIWKQSKRSSLTSLKTTPLAGARVLSAFLMFSLNFISVLSLQVSAEFPTPHSPSARKKLSIGLSSFFNINVLPLKRKYNVQQQLFPQICLSLSFASSLTTLQSLHQKAEE